MKKISLYTLSAKDRIILFICCLLSFDDSSAVQIPIVFVSTMPRLWTLSSAVNLALLSTSDLKTSWSKFHDRPRIFEIIVGELVDRPIIDCFGKKLSTTRFVDNGFRHFRA